MPGCSARGLRFKAHHRPVVVFIMTAAAIYRPAQPPAMCKTGNGYQPKSVMLILCGWGEKACRPVVCSTGDEMCLVTGKTV